MNLKLEDQLFIVCGASSGFGRAISERLLSEGAGLIVSARRKEKLSELQEANPRRVQCVSGDLTENSTLKALIETIGARQLHGAVINAGGPPALAALETSMEQWDTSYQLVLRWKVDLAKQLIPLFQDHNYGRLLFIESQSVKQPIPSLVLSNAFRAAVIGFAKTLSQEVADSGITVNALAPGSHDTPAIKRVIQKRSDESGRNFETVKKEMESQIPVGRMGTGKEMAGLAAWLLSPHAGYVTGQTLSHDGGSISGLFG